MEENEGKSRLDQQCPRKTYISNQELTCYSLTEGLNQKLKPKVVNLAVRISESDISNVLKVAADKNRGQKACAF